MDPQLQTLADAAKRVLEKNNQGSWTEPAAQIYPHQWLWDSAFTAIGLARVAPKRATEEIYSLFRGQWQNGMLPHITFTRSTSYWAGPEFWQSNISPDAPKQLSTSGITQPPMPAIATLKVAASLGPASQHDFLVKAYPSLLAFHEWLYRERDPESGGLLVAIHPWESGLDNTPPWVEAMKSWRPPLWFSAVVKTGLSGLFGKFRSDTKLVPREQRVSNTTALRSAALSHYYKDRHYDSKQILSHPVVAVEDVVFNSIFIVANDALTEIAGLLGQSLPENLAAKMAQTRQALEVLWDEPSGQYYDRNFITKKLIKIPTVATFAPLYSGAITPNRADQLTKLLMDPNRYWTRYPIPSVPIDSPDFHEERYWQGPTWININWLIIEGLKNYQQSEAAEQLRLSTLELIQKAGFREYFSALNGTGYGAHDFSWTAALTLDLLKS